jgi:hypothetical protein
MQFMLCPLLPANNIKTSSKIQGELERESENSKLNKIEINNKGGLVYWHVALGTITCLKILLKPVHPTIS